MKAEKMARMQVVWKAVKLAEWLASHSVKRMAVEMVGWKAEMMEHEKDK